MGPILYFGAVGAVLLAIFLAGGDKQKAAEASPGHPQVRPSADGGGGDQITPERAAVQAAYPYNYGEVSGQSPSSPYGGSTDTSGAGGSSLGSSSGATSYYTGAAYGGPQGGYQQAPPALAPYVPPYTEQTFNLIPYVTAPTPVSSGTVAAGTKGF